MRAGLCSLAVMMVVMPGGAGADAMSATQRAKAGDFDATGEIRCAQEVGQALGSCEVEVARAEGRAAAVVVTFSNGFARVLTFADGAFLRGNATMSGVGTDTDWRLSGKIIHVRVDDQRFELPETLVFGD